MIDTILNWLDDLWDEAGGFVAEMFLAFLFGMATMWALRDMGVDVQLWAVMVLITTLRYCTGARDK